jgi:hypothetical protein
MVKNGLQRFYNDFDYCNCNAIDSPHGAVPPIIKLPTTYLDTIICTIILLPWHSYYHLVNIKNNLSKKWVPPWTPGVWKYVA